MRRGIWRVLFFAAFLLGAVPVMAAQDDAQPQELETESGQEEQTADLPQQADETDGSEETAPSTPVWKEQWMHDSTGWWYQYEDGTYPANCWVRIGGRMYSFDGRGYMRNGGWYRENGSWYYLESSGAATEGWLKLGNTWYYLQPGTGKMATGWYQVKGIWYYSDASGAMYGAGWHWIGSHWFYMDGSGHMLTGWHYIDGHWYYMNGSGYMTTGWQKVDGIWYYLNGSGAMLTGWQKIGNTWYYMDGSGHMLTGWQRIGETWYYLNGSGAMLTGWQKVDGIWYYMNGSGAMLTGWQKIGGKWYYLNGSGAMVTGWLQLGDDWYYLGSDGAMASDTWIGNYYVNGSGLWVQNQGTSSTAAGLKVSQQTDQIIFVEVSGTRAKVWMEEKDSDGNWKQIFSTSSGRIGYNGLGKTKEGDGKTPEGVYSMGQVFGIQPDPGSSQPYLQVDSSHYWVGDSTSPYYNQLVSTRNVSLDSTTKARSEHIVDFGSVYNYCVEIRYNASRTPYAGSAIFLHCLGQGSTGGCVAIPQSDLLTVIRRLQNNAKIVIGTTEDIAKF